MTTTYRPGRAAPSWRTAVMEMPPHVRCVHYLADIGMKTMSRVHRTIVHLSGGQILGSAFGMPVVELHMLAEA